MLSYELRSKLAALQTKSLVEFDSVRKCFVHRVTGKPRPGLTKILAHLVPVPRDTLDDNDEAFDMPVSKKPRKSRNDPDASSVVSNYAGPIMAQCGGCNTAIAWAKAQPALVDKLKEVKNNDKVHGMVVDYQMTIYARRGRAGLFQTCAIVDPCVGTLLEYFDSVGQAVVGTQLPIYSEKLGVATAIDVLATDKETKSKLYLVEIKATRTEEVERNNRQYERLRGRLQRTTLRGLPLSYCMRHKLQLFSMRHIVQEAHGFAFDDAFILRVSPGVVRKYTLNEYHEQRAPQIVRAIALKTGKLSGRKRKLH